MNDTDRSPIAKLRREVDRLVAIPEAHLQAYGVAWSLAVLRCTKAEFELDEAKKRVAC